MIANRSIANSMQSHLGNINLIALRKASKAIRNTYKPPTIPRANLHFADSVKTWKPKLFTEFRDPENTSVTQLWRQILNRAQKKGYTEKGARRFPGGGMLKLMSNMPNAIKIKYMKELEKHHIAHAMAKLYHKRAFNTSNEPMKVTNSNRVARFNKMTKQMKEGGSNPSLTGFQSYRQRKLLPIVAEGLATIPSR